MLKKWYTSYKDHIKLSDYEIHNGMSLELYYVCFLFRLPSNCSNDSRAEEDIRSYWILDDCFTELCSIFDRRDESIEERMILDIDDIYPVR